MLYNSRCYMIKEKHITLIHNNIRIDEHKFITSKGKIKDFATNLSILIEYKRFDVFRVDTTHGALHIQEFWKSPEPKYLQKKKKSDYKGDFGYWKDIVKKNYDKWINLWKKRKR